MRRVTMQRIPDPYRVLGVGRDATTAEIKAAHRRLAKRFHPDTAAADEPVFLAVQGAYELLKDPLRRAEWDRQHAPGPLPPPPRGPPGRGPPPPPPRPPPRRPGGEAGGPPPRPAGARHSARLA